MRVEAIKREDGLYLPMTDLFKTITQNKIWLNVEIIEPSQEIDGYAVLDQILGFCNTERADASVNHDRVIYRKETE
ncbi:MAG: hypothetical protein AB7U45_04115 [Desulfamplus sp.]